MHHRNRHVARLLLAILIYTPATSFAQDSKPTAAKVNAAIDDTAPGWRSLAPADFTKVNSAEDTWSWNEGVLHCTGQPLSVLRTTKQFENVEIVVEWMHEKPAGNSGLFVWVTPESIEKLASDGKPGLPDGIEVQMLDHAFTEMMKAKGRKTDWFGTNGDVFGVGKPFKPFLPTSPNGSRSYPRKHLSKGHGQWNHYYVRAVNGEVRLWVNGEEVSGGNGVSNPRGYLCLESEGSPIQFRKVKVRELPPAVAPTMNQPPPGFTALFNGKDLSGWKGVIEKGKPQTDVLPEEVAAKQIASDKSMNEHWSVVDGVLTFDGEGESLSTAKDYGDFEMFLDWKIETAGDSGIYLRGCPQIQIWDPQHEPYFKMGSDKGSGAIWNNKKNPNRPLVKADNPIGEWNTFHIRMVGEKVTVKLNGELVVDDTVMENYWNREASIGTRGPIFLQDHGSILNFRNIYVRELK